MKKIITLLSIALIFLAWVVSIFQSPPLSILISIILGGIGFFIFRLYFNFRAAQTGKREVGGKALFLVLLWVLAAVVAFVNSAIADNILPLGFVSGGAWAIGAAVVSRANDVRPSK